mmetsp:Transcript_3438/g.10428  ORF Transcript_3438/g.10428 Transcript_3438/m.10428 type:complete len:440 (+) Transcript_3438:110-1429(+)
MEMLEKYDMFRKVYKDLTTTSMRGAVLSVISVFMVVVLLAAEVVQYVQGDMRSTIAVNPHKADSMWLNFHVNFPNLPCDSLAVDILDYKGQHSQNLGATISKTIMRNGGYVSRRTEGLTQRRVKSDQVLGQQKVVRLTHADFMNFVSNNQYVFVNFYASWCPHCQRLAPTWEGLADAIEHKPGARVVIASVDCVAEPKLCANQVIRGYPMLRLFRNGRFLVDYLGQRSIFAFEAFLQANYAIDAHETQTTMPSSEGCVAQLKARIYAVPGQIYFGVKNDKHFARPGDLDLSHTFTWLQFGDNVPSLKLRKLKKETRQAFRALSFRTFKSTEPETTHSHYLKLVGSIIERGRLTGESIYSFQYTATHHEEKIKNHLPEVRVSYDISPTVVRIHNASQRWYEFLTKLCAIVGGFHTLMSLVDSGVAAALQKKRKDNMGKLS